jgi:hypothetical protein
MTQEENIVQDTLTADTQATLQPVEQDVVAQASVDSTQETNAPVTDPPNKRIYNYLVGLYGATGRNYSENNLNIISGLQDTEQLKFWVNNVRSNNKLPKLTDQEFFSLNNSWTIQDPDETQKKKEDSDSDQQQQTAITGSTVSPSTTQQNLSLSDSASQDPKPPSRYIVYNQQIENDFSMLDTLKNFDRNFLKMNEEDAMMRFNKQFRNLGFQAEVAERGEGALLITRPDGSQFVTELMSDMGDMFGETFNEEDFNLRVEQRHNEFLYSLGVEGGGQHMVPSIARRVRENPTAIPEIVGSVSAAVVRPPESFLEQLLETVSGQAGMSTDMFYNAGEFDEYSYAMFLYAAKVAIDPEYEKTIEFVKDIQNRTGPKTSRGGQQIRSRDPRKRDEYVMTEAGRIKADLIPEDVANVRKTKNFIDKAIARFEEQKARASSLISHGLRTSGVFDNADYNNVELWNTLEEQGLMRADVPLSALKINGESASYREMYELISRPLELSYIRNGEYTIEIDKDADVGIFKDMVNELARLEKNNNAKYDPDNPVWNEFERQMYLIPAEVKAATWQMLHDFGMFLDDPLSAIIGPEASKFLLFEEFGVSNGRGVNIQKPHFPSVESVQRAKEGLPEYDYSITDSRTIAEFLVQGKSASMQSLPHTALFLLNPGMGLAATGTTGYGRSREELITAREEARAMQKAGINLTQAQEDMLNMSDAKIRAISFSKGATETAWTAAFTYRFFKDLQGLRKFNNFTKGSSTELQSFANEYAKRYREGIIGSYSRAYGLSREAVMREVPEEMLIGVTNYMVDVIAGREEFDMDKAMKIAADAGVNSLFTSLPMGAAKQQLSRGLSNAGDGIIKNNITLEGEVAQLQVKAQLDIEEQRLTERGVKPTHPKFKAVQDAKAEISNKILALDEEKQRLVDSMSRQDKMNYLNLMAQIEQQHEAIMEGNLPELIDANIRNIENYKKDINKILAKYPSKLGYYFLTAQEKAMYDSQAVDALQSEYSETEDFKLTPEMVAEKASELYLQDIQDNVAPFTPIASAKGQFYQAENYYTNVTPEQKAAFNLRDNIDRARQQNLFEQETDQEVEATPVDATLEQQQATVAEPVEETKPTPKGKPIDDFINRGAQFRNPITGEVMDGDVYLDGQTVVFESKKTGQVFELGNVDEISGSDAANSGIIYDQEVVGVNNDGSITVNDVDYTVQFDVANQGVEYNPDGTVKAVSLRVKGSDKRVMLTGQDAEDAAVKVKLANEAQIEAMKQSASEAEAEAEAPTEEPAATEMPAEVETSDVGAVEVKPAAPSEVNPDIDRKNAIVDRIEALNKSNNFYNSLDARQQGIVVDFFNDIIKGRRPRFGLMENLVRAQELAYEINTLNNGKLQIFKDKFTSITQDAWKKFKLNKYNPFALVTDLAGDIYPFLNDVGRKSMNAMYWNATTLPFGSKSRKNMVTGDILKDALFRNQRAGKPFIDLWNTANQKTAIAINESNTATVDDVAALEADINAYNASLPIAEAGKKINIKNGALGINDDYELQILGHLKRQSGEIDPATGLDTEFQRQRNALLKELELRKKEAESGKSNDPNISKDALQSRYVLLRDIVERIGLQDARSYNDVVPNAKAPLVSALDKMASRFPHEAAKQRKLDYDGQGSFFVQGTYVPTFRIATDGEIVTDGRRVTRDADADVLKDVTMDDQLETSRILFGGYFKNAYKALQAANVDIMSRGDWDTFTQMVNSKAFEDMFVDNDEYQMIQSYFGGRWQVFEQLLNSQTGSSDFGSEDIGKRAGSRAGQATYSTISSIALGGVGQPFGQFYSAMSGSMRTLTDPVALAHARRGGFTFVPNLVGGFAGSLGAKGVQDAVSGMLGSNDLSNIYARSRTNLRSAIKAELLISDDTLLPYSYYAKALQIDPETPEKYGFRPGARYRLNQILDGVNASAEFALDVYLANADAHAANIMFESHYIQARVDQGERLPQDMNAWWAKENENPNDEAIQKADQRIAETMRQTTDMSEAEYYGMDSDWRNQFTKNVFFSWGKFQMNYKSNFANQMARVMDPDLPEVEKQDARRRLNGLFREASMFHGIRLMTDNLTIMGGFAGLYVLAGGEEEDIRRFDNLSIANIVRGAILPIDDPNFAEVARTMSKNEINTMEAFKLMMQEDATGMTSTMLELMQSAHEFQNKFKSGLPEDIGFSVSVGTGIEAQPFAIPPEAMELVKWGINTWVGDEILPEYISRDVERGTISVDDAFISVLDNAGVTSVMKQQVENLWNAYSLYTGGEMTAPMSSGLAGGPEVRMLYAPNEAMERQLRDAVGTLFWMRLSNLAVPHPRKDINKLLNKLERDIEQNFVVKIPNFKSVKGDFFKYYLQKRQEQGALIDMNQLDKWWESEQRNLNQSARRYASDKIFQMRKASKERQ